MHRFSHIISILFAVLFYSCSSNDNNANFDNSGDIIGSVNLYDDSTTSVDNSNMKVSIVGSPSEISDLTDNLGKFKLTNIPFGIYILEFQKVGYGTFRKTINHGQTGRITVISPSPSLGKLSNTEVNGLEVESINQTIKISISTIPPGNNSNRRYVRFFLHTDNSVNNTIYSYYSPVYTAQINPFVKILSQNELNNFGFNSGQEVFVIAYGESFWDNAFDDDLLNKRVFPNINPNTVQAISFVVP
jgi:hypothetical protein